MNCPKCGTQLKETNWGNYLCPNCDRFEKDEIEGDKEEKSESPDYIG